MHTLLTIPFSHFNEKARWALDRFDVPYRERGYMPLLHMLPVMLATRGGRGAKADRVSSRWSTPVLVTDDGEHLCDSAAIVRWVDARCGDADTRLHVDDDATQLEAWLCEGFGADTRRVAYGLGMRSGADLVTLARANVGAVQTALTRVVAPLAMQGIRRSLAIDARRVARSEGRVRETFEEVGRRLGTRPYLVGERFNVADLSFACMAAPVLMPTREEGFGGARGAGSLPTREQLPAAATALCDELRDTVAGRHALRMFAQERRRVVAGPRVASPPPLG